MRRILCAGLIALAAAPAAGDARLDLRYRIESAEQDGLPDTAEAQTLRLRLKLASGTVNGISAFVELDRVEALAGSYNDTRNGRSNYPVIADAEGTELNQAWLQFSGPSAMQLRVGRQNIALADERFVGPVGWRQNDQTFDALRLKMEAAPGFAFDYSYLERVQRVFGPDRGFPPAALASDSHLFNLTVSRALPGSLTLYGYRLRFADAPLFSSDTAGLRFDGERAVAGDLTFGFLLDHARQRDAGRNPAGIDAHYSRAELRLRGQTLGFMAGREVLAGERGAFAADENPAFQTPLATLHPFQGWADKFLTTPAAGIEDLYLGVSFEAAGWRGQATWHEFSAEATSLRYGTEWDLSLARRFAGRYDALLKYADYSADGLHTDTRKLWFQLGASF